MKIDVNTKICRHVSCKCRIDAEDEYCSPFCENVEVSEGDRECGCGHECCDSTIELGNEAALR